MPSFFFDPVWLKFDEQDNTINYHNFSKFKHFTELSQPAVQSPSEHFFPGAFTYHWHNLWDEIPTPGSWFDQFEKSYIANSQRASSRSKQCPFKLRVYVYPLPAKFNSMAIDILKNTTRKDWAKYRTGPGITDSIYDWKSTMLDFATEVGGGFHTKPQVFARLSRSIYTTICWIRHVPPQIPRKRLCSLCLFTLTICIG